jgi:hypothetical protein
MAMPARSLGSGRMSGVPESRRRVPGKNQLFPTSPWCVLGLGVPGVVVVPQG